MRMRAKASWVPMLSPAPSPYWHQAAQPYNTQLTSRAVPTEKFSQDSVLCKIFFIKLKSENFAPSESILRFRRKKQTLYQLSRYTLDSSVRITKRYFFLLFQVQFKQIQKIQTKWRLNYKISIIFINYRKTSCIFNEAPEPRCNSTQTTFFFKEFFIGTGWDRTLDSGVRDERPITHNPSLLCLIINSLILCINIDVDIDILF